MNGPPNGRRPTPGRRPTVGRAAAAGYGGAVREGHFWLNTATGPHPSPLPEERELVVTKTPPSKPSPAGR